MSCLNDLPIYNKKSFSGVQFRGSNAKPTQLVPRKYTATHDRTIPPQSQDIVVDETNLLLRHLRKGTGTDPFTMDEDRGSMAVHGDPPLAPAESDCDEDTKTEEAVGRSIKRQRLPAA